MDLLQSTTVQVSIARQPQDVYAYISNPENFPAWATAFCLSIRHSAGNEWIVETPDGPMSIRFVESNHYGVLDHYVQPHGASEAILNPMRVLANGAGSELIFTLFRQPGMSEEQFAQDARMVHSDLQTLKRVLENDGA